MERLTIPIKPLQALYYIVAIVSFGVLIYLNIKKIQAFEAAEREQNAKV
jgi:hypothetical protein